MDSRSGPELEVELAPMAPCEWLKPKTMVDVEQFSLIDKPSSLPKKVSWARKVGLLFVAKGGGDNTSPQGVQVPGKWPQNSHKIKMVCAVRYTCVGVKSFEVALLQLNPLLEEVDEYLEWCVVPS